MGAAPAVSDTAQQALLFDHTGRVWVRLVPVYVAVFASYFAAGLVLPLAPVTLIDRFGRGESSLGFSLFALSAGGLAGRFVGGALVDGRGVGRGFRVGLLLSCIAAATYSVIVTPELFIAGRALLGFGESLVYIAAATAVIDAVPENRRSRFIGLLGSAVWGGISAGPIVGERLSRVEWAGRITVLSLAIAAVLVVRTIASQRSGGRGRITVRVPREALLPGVVIGLYNLGYAAITGFVIVHLRGHGLATGWALTAYGLAVLFGRLALGGIPDRLGPRPSMAVGIGVMAIALSVIGAAPSRTVVLASLVVFGLGYSMPFPAIASLTVNRVKADERASALAVLGGAYDVFTGVAGAGFGLLAESSLGTGSIYVAAVIATALALALGLIVSGRATPQTV